jgi:Protein of unknown function (DUF3040)
MSLNSRQRHQLDRIETDLRRADPHLGAMFGIFGRLYPGQDLPFWEQPAPPARPGRLRRAAAWILGTGAAGPSRKPDVWLDPHRDHKPGRTG